jgi:hypothetical protein
MPNILKLFHGKKQRSRLGPELRRQGKVVPSNLLQFPQPAPEFDEAFPDHETVTRWLKLADEMLAGRSDPKMDDDSRRKA